MMPIHWTETPTDFFFSRQDSKDLRWGDFTYSKQPSTPDPNAQWGLWGYADDEGISLNGGRMGARFAPDFIRRYLYRLTPPLNTPNQKICDYGNWQKGSSLVEQISQISPLLTPMLNAHPMITLGGGHDYAAVDGAGFLQWCKQTQGQRKPLIINFDAHLDVRPWSSGLNSGTPFAWLLDHYPNAFEFIEVGIQKHCSSPHHQEWVQKMGGRVLDLDYLRQTGVLAAMRQELAGTSPLQPCYLSIDIDVFTQSLAPGCSQSWDAGLEYKETFEAIRWLMAYKNVRLLGIYEVSPPLDIDHRTSKLAACLADEFLRFPVSSKFQ